MAKFGIAAGLIAAIFSGCGERPAVEADQARLAAPELIILQTGRLRGNIYPESLREGNPLQHYPKIAALVKATREEAAASGAKVLLIDLGDSLTGSFAAYATKSENMVDFFNHLGYDAVALGNLDADLPLEALGKLKMPVLTPFIDGESNPVPAGAVNFARIGPMEFESIAVSNFYGDLDPATAPHRFPAWFGAGQRGKPFPVRDYAPLFAKAATDQASGPRLFTWMKFESPDVPPSKFLETLTAGKIDLILAHRIYSGDVKDVWSSDTLIRWTPPVAENILRENRGFTVVRTDMRRDNQKWKVLGSRLIPANSIASSPDATLSSLIERHRQAIADADRLIGELPAPLEKSGILDILLRCLATVNHAEIVAYSPNSIRSELPSGPLKAGQLFTAVPWTGPIATLALRPDEVERALAATPLAALTKENPQPDESGFVHLVTGRFVAEVIRDSLALPEERLSLLEGSTEFGFFSETITKNFDKILETTPDGWTPHVQAGAGTR